MVASNVEEGCSKEIAASSLYYNNKTFMAAKYSADTCLSAVCQVLDDECSEQRGFCIVRPPGHHAHADMN